ncbi:DUF5305 domain-containing protein [Natronosalvus vescus]|uniref:DUF5305 domain-containing protein n=1 Tax=Natronosalvus vescus TaxID=2953881 RepID=UPI002091CD8A|nr:DUF5305 domain-containing protein [Natronosalvus vescus]
MSSTPRLDLLIAQNRRALLIALLVIGAVALVATGWVVANPTTATTTQEVGHQTIETDVQTSAEVVEDGLWEEGTVLENKPAYVLNATPVVAITAESAAPSGTDFEHEIVLRYEATRDGEAFWEDETILASGSSSIADGSGVTQATIDVRNLQEQQDELEDELAGISTVDMELIVRATYDTGPHVGDQVASTPVVITENTYYLEEHPSASETHPLTQTVEEPQSASTTLVGLLVILTAGSFGGAAFVNARSDVDVDQAKQAVHKNRYAEWISNGSLPMWVGEEHIALDTLEDVVDVAIDTNERVIHDRNRGLFAVVSESVVYYYSDRGRWEETAWPDFNLEEQPESQSQPSPDEMAASEEEEDVIPATDLPDPEDDDAWHKL